MNLATLLLPRASAFLSTKPTSFAPATTSDKYYHLNSLQDRDQTDPDGTIGADNAGTENKQAWDWNTTSETSIGSMLVEMQKQEEVLRSSTGKGEEVIQPVTLDAGNNNNNNVGTANKSKSKKERRKEKDAAKKAKAQQKVSAADTADSNDMDYQDDEDESDDVAALSRENLSTMDSATARELDASVTWMVSTPSSRKDLVDSVDVIPLPSLYSSSPMYNSTIQQKIAAAADLPLRMPAHYFERISRDMRHLAVSIASSIEDVDQWRTFCQEGNGGLMPLLECIREGARFINLQKQFLAQKRGPSNMEGGIFLEQHEETFMAACSACRALRDLCAVSPELSAVITDGILRANAAWSTTTTSTDHRSQEFNNYKDEDGQSTTSKRQVHQFGNNLMHDFMTMLRYANEYSEPTNVRRRASNNPFRRNRNRRDARLRCKLYVTQLLLAMTVSSDDAVEAIRDTEGLPEVLLKCSSFSRGEQTRRWLRYPGEILKSLRLSKSDATGGADGDEQSAPDDKKKVARPFMRAAAVQNNLDGHVRRTSNQILAAIGYNRWIPKIPGQKGLRILSLDGGGSRGMVAVSLAKGLVESMGGVEVADSFDIITGTSTGGIIAFLIGLRRESSEDAVERYDALIKQIFVKSALSSTMMLFTTATYDEEYFMDILSDILGDNIMLDSRADPAVPYVCCVASKMSSTPTHVALFRNYNYAGGELADPFTIDPDKARDDLDLPLQLEHDLIRKTSYTKQKSVRPNSGYKIEGSRHPGSFRVLQRYALRASTAAPTVFKPVMMGNEMYCDGGIVASNPTAVAIHEARSIFPDTPIELVVSLGTGGFLEQKNSPRIGWDGIIGQIVNSATDAEQIHHVLEDVLGDKGLSAINNQGSRVSHKTRYYRLNPTLGMPDEFPIDVTEPAKLEKLKEIAADYLKEPEQQRKLQEIGDIAQGRRGWRKWLP